MPNTPSTFRGEPPVRGGVDWGHTASLHRCGDNGVLSDFKAIRKATLADLVRYVLNLPESKRGEYEIEKSGDRRYGLGEILALARRADFPG